MGSVVRIERIVAGGDGLGREPEGRVIFVPRTAPGELVEVEVTETHARWARGRWTQILDPGPDRRDPPCPYYDRCGGCQIQHLSYPAQVQSKSEMIADALRRLGGLEVDLPEILGDPEREFGYRNRVGLTLRRAGDRVFAGYHAWDDPSRIVDVEHCPLAEEPVNAAWRRLRAAWGPGAERLPAGPELRLTLRSTADGEVGLIVRRTADPAGGPTDATPESGPADSTTLGDLEEQRGDPEGLLRDAGLAAIWYLGEGGEIVARAGASTLRDRWGPHALDVAGTAFVQVNRFVAPELERYVRARCGEVEGVRVVDAYCGYGTRALDLAAAGAEVVGIDVESRAIESAEAAATEQAFTARFRAATVEDVLAEELPADLVILNPPRVGVAEAVTSVLMEEPPRRLIYISCDPATLARDLGRLEGALRVSDLCGFDMFPQTAHIEVVATLEAVSA